MAREDKELAHISGTHKAFLGALFDASRTKDTSFDPTVRALMLLTVPRWHTPALLHSHLPHTRIPTRTHTLHLHLTCILWYNSLKLSLDLVQRNSHQSEDSSCWH